MAEPTTAEPPETIDPFAQQLLDSFQKVLPPKPADTPEPTLKPEITLGEAVAITKAGITPPGAKPTEPPQKTAEELAAEKAAADKAAADKAAAEKKAADEKAAAEEAAKRKPVVRRKPEIVDAPPPAAPPATPPKTEPEPTVLDEEFEKGLTEEEREVLELAKFAEKKGRSGTVDETVKFFKAVGDYAQQHPDEDPDGEEFTKFVNQNRPKWMEGRRRLERQMYSEEAAEAARRTLDPVIQQQQQTIREIQARPAIDAAPEMVADVLVTKPEGVEGVEPVDKDVVDLIGSQGYEAAKKRYPAEAPIVMGAMNAAKAYMEIAQGVKQFNAADDTHAWLAQFLLEEGQNMKAQSKEAQVRGGKTFMPMAEFNAEVAKDRAARNKYWTFSNQDVLQLIANRALLTVNQQIKEMEAAGWERKGKKVSAQPGTPPPTPTPTTTGSPRAGGSSLPGAADTTETVSDPEAAAFLKRLGVPRV